jgi:hypothetical protein
MTTFQVGAECLRQVVRTVLMLGCAFHLFENQPARF